MCVFEAAEFLGGGDRALSLHLPQPLAQFFVQSEYPVTVGQVGKKINSLAYIVDCFLLFCFVAPTRM